MKLIPGWYHYPETFEPYLCQNSIIGKSTAGKVRQSAEHFPLAEFGSGVGELSRPWDLIPAMPNPFSQIGPDTFFMKEQRLKDQIDFGFLDPNPGEVQVHVPSGFAIELLHQRSSLGLALWFVAYLGRGSVFRFD